MPASRSAQVEQVSQLVVSAQVYGLHQLRHSALVEAARATRTSLERVILSTVSLINQRPNDF